MQTISELNKTIEIMRQAYPFKDEKTEICLARDLITNDYSIVKLVAVDETDTLVTLERRIERGNE